MNDQSNHHEEWGEVIGEIELEQLIQDFIALGREFLQILRDLISIEEDYEDKPPLDIQSDEENDLD